MANPTTGFFQTVILPAVADIQAPATFQNSMVGKVYIQDQPIQGTVGQTINVNVPVVNEGDVVDIGSGAVQVTDESHTTVALTINNNKSITRRINEFDQVRTPLALRQFYLQPMVESLLRKVDRTVCNLVTSTNFNTYGSITGGADVFSRINLSTAWTNLVGGGCPFSPGKNHFVTSHIPFGNMLSTTDLYQESIVGINTAEIVQQKSRFMPLFNCDLDYDQLFPVPSAGAYAGLMFHSNAIAIVPAVPRGGDTRPQVDETYYTVPGTGLQFRIQYWYDPMQQANLLHCHCIYALAVVRPEYGSFLVST